MEKEGTTALNGLVCMAEIVGVHGIKGMLKLKIFSEDPDQLMGYAPLFCPVSKKEYKFTSLHAHQNVFLATMEGLSDRTAAEKLRGTKLYVPRDRLPVLKKPETYYHVDLVGLAAQNPDGELIGKIISVADFGAGTLLEIKPVKGASYFIPFTNDAVPNIDLTARTATVIIPAGLLD